MTKVAITEQYLTDIADAIRAKTGMSTATYYPSQMATAISTISGSGGITPTGTISITENGTYNVTSYASASVSVSTGSTINNQNKTVNPSTSQQSITADSGYTGLGTVTVTAMPAGTAGTPTATKGTVSNNSISVTPSVTNTTGYITGSTKTGTAVTVSASELVSGNKSITSNGSNIDVTNYATVSVNVSGGGGITPSGNLDITESGTIDVTNYATVTVPIADASAASASIQFITENSVRKWRLVYEAYAESAGWVNEGGFGTSQTYKYNAVSANTTITPTESVQTIGGANYMMEGAVTVSAISTTYVGSGITRRSSTDLTASGATVTVSAGYYASQATKSVTTMTLPTSVSASATSGYTSKATISRSTSDQYINIAPGYNSAGGYYKISAVANGSASAPTSISGTSATVSTGTNTLTLTKTVSVTPVVSAGYVSSGTATNSSVSLTASVTTKAAATITPGTTNQTIASGTYLTGAQTIAGDANLVESNIKKNVTIFGKTGTYEGSGGGGESGLTVATASTTLSAAGANIQFTGLSGQPTSFVVICMADMATASASKTAVVAYDGTTHHGDLITNTSNAQVTYTSTGPYSSYSGGTLTITSSGADFQASQYKLVYTYGGSSSDIGTASVQVGSGATSISFTGLSDEPSYFSCVFKSNFSTSSGYQRTIAVVYDGSSTYGLAMDSGAKALSSWSYTYNSGTLTISSVGTNNGGYFHQPGYYQLTYATEGSSGNYQSKTVYATSSQQVITADSAYDALKQVTIPAVTTTNLSASNIINGVTIQVGDSADSDRIASVTGNVVLQNYYTGSSAPSSATGSNGDLYLQS